MQLDAVHTLEQQLLAYQVGTYYQHIQTSCLLIAQEYQKDGVYSINSTHVQVSPHLINHHH